MRSALRQLVKNPGFSLVVVLTLALGLASATTIFSVARGVLFRPLPVPEADRLVWIWSTRPDRDRAFFSIPNFLDLRRQSTTAAGLAALTPVSFNVTGDAEPERVPGWLVSGNLFAVLGVQPVVGRLPAAADDNPAAAPLVVLGHGYWQRRFGGDPAVVGRTVILNGTPQVVAGVLPPDFGLPHWSADVILAQSLETDARSAARGTHFLRAVARLRPGVTREQFQEELARHDRALAALHPATNAGITAPRVVPLFTELVGDFRGSLQLLLGAVGALLLIMCANLAGLFAARGLTRRRDAALCVALGATPGRLLRDQLAEGFVLTFLGGALGLLVCTWGLDALLALAPADLPRAELIRVDHRVLLFTGASALLTWLGVCLLPAWRLARTDPQLLLLGGSRGASARLSPRGLLVVTQLALCTTLLAGTGLLYRSLQNLLAAHPGFTSAGVLAAQVSLPAAAFDRRETVTPFLEEGLRRLAVLPGVESAGLTSILPLSGLNTRSEFTRGDRPPARPGDLLSAANRFVSEDYFRTVGIPLLAGRDFTAADDDRAPSVVIVDESLARRHWPGEDPVGRTILLREGAADRSLLVVGVVGSTKHFSLEESATPALYFPCRQIPAHLLPFFTPRINFVLRTAGDPAGLSSAALHALRGLAVDATVAVRPLDRIVAWARAQRRFNLQLLGFFSVSAVLLAGIGLYAVTAQAVGSRTREIGIRMALGADRRRIARHVLTDGMRLLLAGLGTGLALFALLASALTRMLHGVGRFDPGTLAAVALGLAAVSLLALWLLARRATRIDPTEALRAE